MNLVTKDYLGSKIEFKMIDGMVYANANTMAQGFGGSKKIENWKASSKTKECVEAISNSLKSRELTISEEGKFGGICWK